MKKETNYKKEVLTVITITDNKITIVDCNKIESSVPKSFEGIIEVGKEGGIAVSSKIVTNNPLGILKALINFNKWRIKTGHSKIKNI